MAQSASVVVLLISIEKIKLLASTHCLRLIRRGAMSGCWIFIRINCQRILIINFYCTLLKSIPLVPSKPWFSVTPVGWNKLDAVVVIIFKNAGISGKTNHRLRVTGATHMYNSGIPEKTSRAGLGVEALRVYERPSKEQQAKHAGHLPVPKLNQLQALLPLLFWILPIVHRLRWLLSTRVVPTCLSVGF